MREAASKDSRALKIVSELRIKRMVDRLTTSANIAEEMVEEMWRVDNEEHDEEESLCLKKSIIVAANCIKQNVDKLRLILLSMC